LVRFRYYRFIIFKRTLKSLRKHLLFLTFLTLAFVIFAQQNATAQCNGIDFKTNNSTKGCSPLLVKFLTIGTSSAAGTKFQWDFGNGFVNGSDTITAVFSTQGQYTIRMQATLSGSNTPCPVIEKDTFITVLSPPKPVISASTGLSDCDFTPSTKIVLTDNTPNATSSEWIVGSNTNYSKTYTVTFPSAGSYPVSLYSTNKYGCTVFGSQVLQMIDSVPVDICANFNVTQNGITGVFTPDVGDTGSRTITGYTWSFPGGNPSSSTDQYPGKVTYSDPTKKHDVILSILTSNGCRYTMHRIAFVSPFLTPAFQTECATGFEVFADLTDPKKGFWNYNFPNGTIMATCAMCPEPPFILSYPEGGTYSAGISYQYTNGLGCNINVNYPFFVKTIGPRAGFSSLDNQICNITDTVHLTNTSDTTNASNVKYTWYIFDSTDSKLLTKNFKIGPTSHYDTIYIPGRTGKFGVSLVAVGSTGCRDSVNTANFIISARPKSDFDSLKNPIVCKGNDVTLTAKPTPPEGKSFSYKYKWYITPEAWPGLIDSASTSAINGYHPDSFGVYDVRLVISNGHCSSDTTKKAFFTTIGDIPKIAIGNTFGCLSPDYTTTAKVIHEEKYPNDPNHPTLYHWYLDPSNYATAYIKFSDPDSPSTNITISKSGCYGIYLSVSTILNGDTCVEMYPAGGAPAPTICIGPGLSFTPGPLNCPGDTVDVTNYSQKGDFGFKWAVSPASLATILPSDTAHDVRIVFKADTCYFISLAGSRTVNGATCSDADTAYACFHIPKPSFYSTTPSFYCAPAVGTFVNTTTNASNATGYIWYFGDGDSLFTSDTNRVSHIYLHFNQGSYNITLKALNASGCNESLTLNTGINVVGPVPLFTMNESKGCDSVTVNFTNTSKNVHKFYFLNGDGSPPDSLSLPSHTYILNDTSRDSIVFYPTLLSLDDTTCRDFYQDSIKIYRAATDVTLLNDISVGCTPLTVHFTGVSKTATSYKWDFNGDGIIDDSVDQSPFFTYTKPGFYKASLTVSNHGQCPITVFSNPIEAAPNAIADFVPSTKAFCGTQTISFTNKSKNGVRFTFDFGDGSPIDSNVIATHKYYYDPSRDTGAARLFFPTIIVYNAGGCPDTLTDTISAYRLPIAGFTSSALLGCDPLKVDFIDTSKYNFAAEWDFDNNGVFDAYGKKVNHVYSPGLYTVKMEAITIQGCVDSIVKVNLVTVNPVPKADFSFSDSDICYRDSVQFYNLTQPADSIVKWSWKFNDPAAPFDTSSLMNPYFNFYSKGWHTVTLTAVDNRGCSDTISKKAVFVEDTVPPPNTKLLYVSVYDPQTILVYYNKSSIRHFETYRINRISDGSVVVTDTANYVGDTMFVYQDATINTSDTSYCFSIQTENQCGRVSFGSFPHCTILLAGYSNPGPGNLLSWTAYSGWNPDWYYIYRADSGGSFKIIDSVKGSVLYWTDTALCDQTYCYYIAAKNDSGGYLSNSNSICLKAKYVKQNTPLYMHYATVANNSVVQLQWDTSAYKGLIGYLLGKYNPNTGWTDNYAFTKSNTYTDVAAKINDTSYIYRVRTIDKCGYVGPESNVGTSILLKQSINNDNVALSWNAYRNWQGGVQNYLVQVQLKNKQFKNVANLPGTDTSYTDDSVYNAIDTAYCYRVIAIENGTRRDTSISNLTCAVLPSRVFVPTAFSPNSDSLNDVWKVSAVSVFNAVGPKLLQFDAKIYNRWGILVFESNDIYKGWDGTFKSIKAPADVYIYVVSAEGIDKRYIQLKGNVTLLR